VSNISNEEVLPPTELFSTRHEVEHANSTHLATLQSPPITFDAHNLGSAAPEKCKVVLANMRVPDCLVLKQGAQVMLIKNIDNR